MSVTTLVGTTWTINSNADIKTACSTTVSGFLHNGIASFISNGNTYSSMETYPGKTTDSVKYDSTIVYETGWKDDAYRTVEILRVKVADETNLIAWFEANAVQQLPTVIDYLTTDTELTSIANAIRTKGGTSASLTYPAGFVSAIQAISTGTDVSDTTATASDVLSGKYFYTSNGTKTQGSIASKTSSDLTSSVLTVTAPAGHYASNATKTLTDANLTAGNIKKDVSIFGVTGSYEGSGGGAVYEDDVNFYDYDGTILYSYSASDFANLSAMPSNPSHTGLTAQGWNWTLSDAKTQVESSGKLSIGQMYVTSDGKTRVYITIDKDNKTIPLYWNQSIANGVSIDWGDGTSSQTFSGTGYKNTTHTYSISGDYIIALSVTSGKLLLNSLSNNIFDSNSLTVPYNFYVYKIEIGTNVEEINYFNGLYKLESITIPQSVTASSKTGLFQSCYNLKFVTLPNAITAINGNCFSNCYSLRGVSIPKNVTSIGGSAFNNCYSMDRIIIPNGVLNFDNTSMFNACYGVSEIIIPDAITNIPSSTFYDCRTATIIPTIPSSATSIGSNAYRSNYALISVTVPSNVVSISSSFYGCGNLCVVHMKPTSPPTLSSTSAFSSTSSNLVIYVPYSADHSILNAYKTANNWSTYASKMQEEPAS